MHNISGSIIFFKRKANRVADELKRIIPLRVLYRFYLYVKEYNSLNCMDIGSLIQHIGKAHFDLSILRKGIT